MAFLAVLAFRTHPADPANRLPGRYRLVDLIEEQQRQAADLRAEVARLRADVDAERSAGATRSGGAALQAEEARTTATSAGLVPVTGPGLEVTLVDSKLDAPPSGGNVNDLVIHSQDVQAVVNALWRAGSEAIAINGQRLVSTSAVLCVGNTLLLNGSVHSPPYEVTAIGASRAVFESDQLVRQLHTDADAFGLRFSVEQGERLRVPAYAGVVTSHFARPQGQGG